MDKLLAGLAKCPECGGCGSALQTSPSGIHFYAGNWGDPPQEVRCETCGGGSVTFFWQDDIYYLLGFSYVYFCVAGLQHSFKHTEAEVDLSDSLFLV